MLPDADDTAVSTLVLNQTNRTYSPSSMVSEFATAENFRTYAFESNPSFSANCNIILALLSSSSTNKYSSHLNKAIKYLVGSAELGIITDKWNTSENYSRMLLCRVLYDVLRRHHLERIEGLGDDMINRRIPALMRIMLTKCIAAQSADGSWDHVLEVTAYSVIAIAHILRLPWSQQVRDHAEKALQHGRQYLKDNASLWDKPSRHWVEKVSYGSAVLSEAYCLAGMASLRSESEWTQEVREIFNAGAVSLPESCTSS